MTPIGWLGIAFIALGGKVWMLYWAIQRTEAEYGVLKTRIEKLEETIRNGR